MTIRHLIIATSLLALAACGGTDGAEGETAPGGGGAEGEAAASAATISVRAASVERGPLRAWLFAEGTTRAVEREFLSFEQAGRVAYVNLDLREGSPVKVGDVVAYQQETRVAADLAGAEAGEVETRTQVTVAEAAVAEAEANLALAQNNYDRFEALLAKRSASQLELDEARVRLVSARAGMAQARAQLTAVSAQIRAQSARVDRAAVSVSESRIVSPIDGVLARLNVEEGQFFTPGIVQTSTEEGALRTVPVVIIDPSTFELTIDLPGYNAGQVEVGAPVVISLGGAATPQSGVPQPGQPGTVRAEVYAVSPSLDPGSRTFEVTIRTSADADRLQDGQFVTAWIAGAEAPDALSVPLDALRYQEGEPFAFVVNEAGRAERRQVALGLQGLGRREVTSGLGEGERVVTEGRTQITGGELVRVIGDDEARVADAVQ